MSMEHNFVVYAHKKATDGSIFYIGKGMEDRPYKKTGRSRHWRNIVKKHGYEVSILHENITETQAFELEKHYIAFYGRKDQGKGPLVNLTGGGEGLSNPSAETRAKLSEAKKGKTLSEETRAKLSAAKKGKTLSDQHRAKLSEAKKGKTLSAQQRAKMSEAKKGKPKSAEARSKMSEARRGGKHPKAKPVINLETGIYYSCAKEAAQVYGMNYDTLKCMLSGHNRNKTSLVYA